MRKHQQKQILELLKTIEEVQAAGEYSDCREAAMHIGEFVKSLEGEGTKTTALLDEYCELLLKAKNGEIGENPLKKHLMKLENSVNTELKPARIEVVFFPYQPSMFDSLESIYLAAAADPNCDAYVVPVPHYQLNPDETLGELIYNGEQYPKNIPITDWQEYDVETRYPDVIFTHYPFDDDGGNYTIHPDYYSKRLRECCELLIHVPYFVVGAKGSVAEYYGSLPGELYAHHVIVQSEKARQSYIENYRRYDKACGWKGKFGNAEEKFIALGSPKFDKVISSKPDDFGLPDEWQELIYKQDGTKKKIILFNTHMFKWINGGEAYFQKLQHVFDTFKKRDDVILWWRPHPMTEKNFKSKAPQLLEQYRQVVEYYKSESFGIYDDTSDLHRAITWSDAYYGDWSSVLTLYILTGKPVMAQNMDIIDEDEFALQPVYQSIVGDEEIYFSVPNYSMPFKMEKNGESTYLGEINNEDSHIESGRYYALAAKVGGNVYFAPMMAREIAVYSTEQDKIAKIPYDTKPHNTEINDSFQMPIPHKGYIYFIPSKYSAIACMDIKTKEISYYSDWFSELKKQVPAINEPSAWFSLPCIVGEVIYFSISISNHIIEFNLETQKHVIHSVGQKDYRYGKICFDNENFWLTPLVFSTDTPVVKWHPQKGIIREYHEIKQCISAELNGFVGVYFCGYIYLIPWQADKAYKINVSTDEFTIAEEFSNDCSRFADCQYRFTSVQLIDDKLYAIGGGDAFITYDLANNTRSEQPIELPPDIMQAAKKMSLNRFSFKDGSDYAIYRERKDMTMQNLCDYLVSCAQTDTDVGRRRALAKKALALPGADNAGSDIYEHVKK